MTLRSVLVRVAVALLLAVTAISALVFTLRQQDAEAHGFALRGAPPGPPFPRTDLPPLGRTAQPVWICSAWAQVPENAAPLLRVLPDGSVAMVRPAPLAQRPGQVAETVPTVLVPRPLEALNPAQRGALLECLAALVADRPVPTGSVRVAHADGTAVALDRLLDWLP